MTEAEAEQVLEAIASVGEPTCSTCHHSQVVHGTFKSDKTTEGLGPCLQWSGIGLCPCGCFTPNGSGVVGNFR